MADRCVEPTGRAGNPGLPQDGRPLPWLLAILGPTASGKSALAVAVARAVGGEVVNCDSRQVYRDLAIGTARPTAADCDGIAHHLYALVTPDRAFSAHDYRTAAVETLAAIWARGRVPVLCGGTGLYYQALIEGLPQVPPPDPALRGALQAEFGRTGVVGLQAWLGRVDPAALATIDARNPHRLMRAIELVTLGRRPLAELRRTREPLPCRRAVWVVTCGADELRHRIVARVDAMLAAGLEAEVRAAVARYGPTAPGLNAIGYREWFATEPTSSTDAGAVAEQASGAVPIVWQPEELARARIIVHTRQYAKRQLTWFRRRPGGELTRLDVPGALDAIVAAGRAIVDT